MFMLDYLFENRRVAEARFVPSSLALVPVAVAVAVAPFTFLPFSRSRRSIGGGVRVCACLSAERQRESVTRRRSFVKQSQSFITAFHAITPCPSRCAAQHYITCCPKRPIWRFACRTLRSPWPPPPAWSPAPLPSHSHMLWFQAKSDN